MTKGTGGLHLKGASAVIDSPRASVQRGPGTPRRPILTHEQIVAQLEERGLPVDLVGVLREAPAELDPGEDDDPFGN